MVKLKLKTFLLVLLGLVLTSACALFAANVIRSAKADEKVQAITDVSIKIDNGIRVLYTVELPEGYTDPELQIERGAHSVTLKNFVQEGDSIVFSYGGVRVGVMNENIHATLVAQKDGQQATAGENDFKVSTELNKQFALTAQQAGLSGRYPYLAHRAYAANALNLGEVATGEHLWEANSSYIFADENRYREVDWGARDNLTNVAGENKDGFEWVGLPALDLNQGFYLRYTFKAASEWEEDLRVKIDFQGETEWTIPVKTGEENGLSVYSFGYGFNAYEFSSDAQVTVYSGETAISATSGYSMNRALGYGAAFGDDNTKALASAMWAFGKAAA